MTSKSKKNFKALPLSGPLQRYFLYVWEVFHTN